MDGIEETKPKIDISTDANEGKSMLDFVKSEVDLGTEVKPEGETVNATDDATPSIAQEVGITGDKAADVVDANKPDVGIDKDKDKAKDKDATATDDAAVDRVDPAAVDKGPVPYERFEEINNKYKVTTTEYEKIKPLAESHQQIQQYCEQWGITQDQFSNLLDIQRLLNTEPEKALAKILPIVEQVQGFTGDRLPQDLQKEVDNAQITLERAREVAKLRAQTQFGGQRFQQFQQIQQQKQHQEFVRQQVTAVNAWVAAKANNDPDFKPRKDASAPRGRFEFTYDAMQSMLAERDDKGQLVNVIRTPDDAAKLLEKAYQDVTRSLVPLSKKAATRKPLTQNGSTSANNGQGKFENAKSMSEAIRMAAAGHGI